MMKLIRSHTELEVYQMAFRAAMDIFEISKSFPKEERYSLTDQIRRSSGSVSSNIAEAFRKDGIPKHLFGNYQIQKEKQQRPRFGLIMPLSVIISARKSISISTQDMIKSWVN